LVRTGDAITIDAQPREITLTSPLPSSKDVVKTWTAPKPYARRGALAKYARQVSSASLGAVTDLEPTTANAARLS